MPGFDAIAAAPVAALSRSATLAVELPVAVIEFLAAEPTAYASVELPVAVIDFLAVEPAACAAVELPVVTVQFETLEASTMRDVVIPAQRIYRAYLDDIELPITSIQTRLRQATNSYLSVVVPDSPTYATIVADHASGELRVMQGSRFIDGTEQLELLAVGTLKLIDDGRGAKSRSLTLSAYGDNASANPRRRDLQGASYTRTSGGSTNVRAVPDAQLKPGDTAVWAGGEIEVDLVTLVIGLSANGTPNEMMEIAS